MGKKRGEASSGRIHALTTLLMFAVIVVLGAPFIGVHADSGVLVNIVRAFAATLLPHVVLFAVFGRAGFILSATVWYSISAVVFGAALALNFR